MKISHLRILNYRNISSLDIEPSTLFNVIYGKNGSGKTSLLEAISYLGYGRSFRDARYQSLIREEQPYFAISADVIRDSTDLSDRIGVCRYRNRNQSLEISINSNKSTRLVDLVDKISVQVIHPQGIDLILGGPEYRRNFIDWGAYYSFPNFKNCWYRYKKLLSQRNSMLKRREPAENIQVWDEELSKVSEEITTFREQYIDLLKPILLQKLSSFLPQFEFEILFSKGWENGLQLRSVLNLNIEKDRVLGYTFYGCHRAELRIKCNNFSASETLSRGQLKLLVCAMRLSQGYLLKHQVGKNCIYLIDDLSSELDANSRMLLLNELKECDSQVFLTNITNKLEIPSCSGNSFIDIEKSIEP